MKIPIIIFFIVLVSLVAIKWVLPGSLRFLGNQLVYTTDLAKSDAIVVLSGGLGNRTKLGIDLYKKGLSSKLILSGGQLFRELAAADLMSEYALELNVKKEDIVLERQSQSTYENATFTLKKLQQLNIRSIIVVTSNFHTKRSFKIFQKVLKGSDIKIQITGSEDNIDYDQWWKDYESSQKILTECFKSIVYKIIH
ncbi:YdcF family protein [Candidatus Marinamargulisbacteria bacterium SCGC AG-410-N11]|nr:YdcF family protein [Candidatus Marinamargulisbacteria bacterium SCGC AG-410-N11]